MSTIFDCVGASIEVGGYVRVRRGVADTYGLVEAFDGYPLRPMVRLFFRRSSNWGNGLRAVDPLQVRVVGVAEIMKHCQCRPFTQHVIKFFAARADWGRAREAINTAGRIDPVEQEET